MLPGNSTDDRITLVNHAGPKDKETSLISGKDLNSILTELLIIICKTDTLIRLSVLGNSRILEVGYKLT